MTSKDINDGHYIELLDRLHVAMCTIDEHCSEHPVAKANKDIEKMITDANELLMQAYQAVGSKSIAGEWKRCKCGDYEVMHNHLACNDNKPELHDQEKVGSEISDYERILNNLATSDVAPKDSEFVVLVGKYSFDVEVINERRRSLLGIASEE